MINSVLSTGVSGIQRGYDTLNRSADQIVKVGLSPSNTAEDLMSPMVDQVVGKIQVQASAKVIETASEVLGTLIDIKV